jgi:hypothetical protein
MQSSLLSLIFIYIVIGFYSRKVVKQTCKFLNTLSTGLQNHFYPKKERKKEKQQKTMLSSMSFVSTDCFSHRIYRLAPWMFELLNDIHAVPLV